MALNIKNAETERLARELARRRGKGITEAVTEALRRELQQERKKSHHTQELLDDLDEITERLNRRPHLDERSADAIVGYNESGHLD